MRDPKKDPKPGDIIQPQQYKDFPMPSLVTVNTRLDNTGPDDLIACIKDGDVFWVTLEHWNHIYKYAEVIHVAD